MHTEDTTTLTPQDQVDRRELLNAAREIIKFKMQYVTAQHGITTQNLYTWLKYPARNSLGEAKQLAALEMFGLQPDGALLHNVLHAWTFSGAESTPYAETLFTHETDIRDVVITPAYTLVHARRRDPNERIRCFIGASVTWTAPPANSGSSSGVGKPRGKKAFQTSDRVQKRLIITVQFSNWTPDAFIAWLSDFMHTKSKRKAVINADLDVTENAAECVWRWLYKSRLANGGRPTLPPNKGLLPFDQDIVGETITAPESAISVLQEMVPRFRVLAQAHAEAKKGLLARTDQSLLRRADNVISATTQSE